MIGVTELRAGTAFREDGQVWVVVTYEHVKMGRGTATIKVKVRNLETGAIILKSFISGARVDPAHTMRTEMTYLYNDGDKAYLMDPRNYEQIEMNLDLMKDSIAYMKEGMTVQVLFLDEEEGNTKPITVSLPTKMAFKVVEADPGVKGDSAANMLKNVTLENGLIVRAPLFIKEGESIVVDTRTGTYVERA